MDQKALYKIHLSYLQGCTATYNASGNVFHPDGAPTEIDIALTFNEAKALTREDLYVDENDFHTTRYSYDRKHPMPPVTAEDAAAAGAGAVSDALKDPGP